MNIFTLALGLTMLFPMPVVGAQSNKVGNSGMSSLSKYLMPLKAEISLARSAAPKSISNDAEILVLTRNGFRRVIKGTNGFVCLVARSWSAGYGDPDFWNPRVRAPICYNAVAAISQVPETIKRTQVALAGGTETQIRQSIKASINSGALPLVEVGSMAFMLSKATYFNRRTTHWRPHLMFFVPETNPEYWGAGFAHSPILGINQPDEHMTVFLIPLSRWSDGTLSRSL